MKCQEDHYRCQNEANWLLREPGGRNIGHYCKAHVDAIRREYLLKLGEIWTATETDDLGNPLIIADSKGE